MKKQPQSSPQKTQLTKFQLFVIALVFEMIIGIGAGLIHPVAGWTTEVVLTVAHIVRYQDKDRSKTR
jgi:hypothetical protein